MMITDAGRGLTLVELVVTLAVLAILAAITAPSMRALIARHQQQSSVDGFARMINTARTDAIRRSWARGSIVAICTGRPADGCVVDAPWNEGAIVFADFSRNCRLDDGEEILRVFPGFRGTIAGPPCIGFTKAPAITDQDGVVTHSSVAFRFEHAGNCTDMIVALGGRPGIKPCDDD